MSRGRANTRVFPEPVNAMPIMSRPLRLWEGERESFSVKRPGNERDLVSHVDVTGWLGLVSFPALRKNEGLGIRLALFRALTGSDFVVIESP